MPHALLSSTLNIFFPPRCLSCDAGISAPGALCPECWGKVHFITDPCCISCGAPFEYDLGAGARCEDCLRNAPPFSRARAVMRYDDSCSALIKKLKYQDETRLSRAFTPWLLAAGRELLPDADAIIPVPLYYWRFVHRRYNQAALLAQGMARQSALSFWPDGLIRVRATAQQTGLSKSARTKNVKDAFCLNPRYLADVTNKTLVLVDDVYTTGATLSACAETLLSAGAARVFALTLARRV